MNRKFVKFLLITIITAGSASAAPGGELAQYNSLLKTIEGSNVKHSLQGLLYVAKDLEEKGAPLKTKGFIPAGEKNIMNPHFFLELAKKRGTEEDTKFFETYSKFTDTEWVDPWHAYMDRTPEGITCLNTSSPYLYDFYTGWLKNLGGFPTYDYIGTLDIYQTYATEQLTMYEFHLVKYPYCDAEKAEDDISSFIDKVKNSQDDTNMNFSKRVIRAIKSKRQ